MFRLQKNKNTQGIDDDKTLEIMPMLLDADVTVEEWREVECKGTKKVPTPMMLPFMQSERKLME